MTPSSTMLVIVSSDLKPTKQRHWELLAKQGRTVTPSTYKPELQTPTKGGFFSPLEWSLHEMH